MVHSAVVVVSIGGGGEGKGGCGNGDGGGGEGGINDDCRGRGDDKTVDDAIDHFVINGTATNAPTVTIKVNDKTIAHTTWRDDRVSSV